MKKMTLKFVGVSLLLVASLFYAYAQSGKIAAPTPKPQRVNGCCNKTESGGLTGCTKPHYPQGGGATCPGKMVKAKCDANHSNCTEGNW